MASSVVVFTPHRDYDVAVVAPEGSSLKSIVTSYVLGAQLPLTSVHLSTYDPYRLTFTSLAGEAAAVNVTVPGPLTLLHKVVDPVCSLNAS